MPWPNFIICGMKKAATTSLYEYMQQHPDIYMSPIKETKYFLYDPSDPFFVNAPLSKYPIRTQDEYLALFNGVKHEHAIGEASPSYVLSDRARRQIVATIPNVKCIFSLRNPVDRLYSSYQMDVRSGVTDVSFDKFVKEEPGRLRQFEYSHLIRPWIEEFDRHNLYFVLFEKLRSSPIEELSQVFGFLGVDDSFVPTRFTQHNTGGLPKRKSINRLFYYVRKHPLKRTLTSVLPTAARRAFTNMYTANLEKAPPMPSELRAFLNDYFDSDITELSRLVKLDLSIWSQNAQSHSKTTAHSSR